METANLSDWRRWLVLLLVCTLSAHAACAQDDSQRPLPLPEQATADPGIHLELLKRLRSTVSQQAQSPRDGNAAKPPNSPQPDSRANTPPRSPDDAAQPESSAASGLRQLGDLISQWKDRLPENMLPPGLDQLTPQQLQKGVQAPESQQKLRELLQQFQKDGMLPPPATDGAGESPLPLPPTPTPPTTPPPTVPRSSLKALDNFLRMLQEKATAPESTAEDNRGLAGPLSEPSAESPAAADSRNADSAADAAGSDVPQPGTPRPPGRSLRRRDRGSVNPPAVPRGSQSGRPAPRNSSPNIPNTPSQTPPNSGNAGDSGSVAPGDATPGDANPEAADAGAEESPRLPGTAPQDTTPPLESGDPLAERPQVPQGPPAADGTDRGPNARKNQLPNTDSQSPDATTTPSPQMPRQGRQPSDGRGAPTPPTAPKSALESLQRLFQELAEPGTARPPGADAGANGDTGPRTNPGAEANQGAGPGATTSPGTAQAPPTGQPRQRPQTPRSPQTSPNSGANGSAPLPGPAGRATPPGASAVPPQRSPDESGGRREDGAGALPRGDRVPQDGAGTESSGEPFSVEEFLRQQLQDPELRSAAESPEMQRAIQRMLQQGGGAAGGTGTPTPGESRQRGNGPPDPSASPRSDHRAPRPQDGRADVPISPGQEPPAAAPRNVDEAGAENSADNATGNNTDNGAERDRQAERVQQQLQSKGFGATLRQLMDEARRDVQQQREQQDEQELAERSGAAGSRAEGLPEFLPQPGSQPPAERPSGAPGSGKAFDPRSLLEMLDRLGDPPRGSAANDGTKDGSDRGFGDADVPGNLNMLQRDMSGGSAPIVGESALERMRQMADQLISGKKSPEPATSKAAAGGSSTAGSASASASSRGPLIDWTPALILAGVLAVAGVFLLAARWSLRRPGKGEQGLEAELLRTTQSISTQADIIRAFHQLARRCSRAVRPWWNHQQLASELSRVLPERKQMVSELAAVYERARYQPREQALTAEEVAAARGAIRSCAAASG